MFVDQLGMMVCRQLELTFVDQFVHHHAIHTAPQLNPPRPPPHTHPLFLSLLHLGG